MIKHSKTENFISIIEPRHRHYILIRQMAQRYLDTCLKLVTVKLAEVYTLMFLLLLTGSTVVLTCCKGDGQSQWKTPILAPHSSETP